MAILDLICDLSNALDEVESIEESSELELQLGILADRIHLLQDESGMAEKVTFVLADVEFDKYECEICSKETAWSTQLVDENGNRETFHYCSSCTMKLFRIAKEVARLWIRPLQDEAGTIKPFARYTTLSGRQAEGESIRVGESASNGQLI